MDAMYLAMSGWKCEDCGVEVQRELGATGEAGDDEAIQKHKAVSEWNSSSSRRGL